MASAMHELLLRRLWLRCWANLPWTMGYISTIPSRDDVHHACSAPLHICTSTPPACSEHIDIMVRTDTTTFCFISTLVLCQLAFLQPAAALTNLALECGQDWHAWVLDGVACSEVEVPCADLQGSVAAGAAQIALSPDFAWSESEDDSCACGSGTGRFAIDTPSRNLFYEEKGTASFSCYYGEGQCDVEGGVTRYECDIIL